MKNKWLFVLVNIMLTIVVSASIVTLGGIIIKGSIEQEVEETKVNVVSTVESDIEHIYEGSVNGVVFIESKSRFAEGVGSGFIYKIEDGYAYILTNYHVIDGASVIDVTTNAGEVVAGVEYLGGDELFDIAVLKSPVTETMIELPVKEMPDYNVGEHVMAIGSPLGKEFINTATVGIVSGTDRFLELDEENSWGLWLIQTDTAINPGNSGGPLFTMDGEVIGINTLKFVQDGVEGMGFAIPIDKIIPKLSAFEAGKSVRPVLGISARETEYGVEVGYVENGSAADFGGVEVGDIITKFGGVRIKDVNSLKQTINDYVVGDEVEMVVLRDGKEKRLDIELID